MHLVSMNPLGSGQITQSSMVGAKVAIMVLSTVVINTLAVVLITLAGADSKDGLVEQSAILASLHLVLSFRGKLKVNFCRSLVPASSECKHL